MPYRVIRIAKKSGGFRTIYAPDANYKARLRQHVPRLNRLLKMMSEGEVSHGFYPGRSPVTNAMMHVGFQFSVCFDLADFFDTVTSQMVLRYCPELVDDCFIDGAARQGLPTSPGMANLAAISLDRAVVCWLGTLSERTAYSRYADDLSFSFDVPELVQVVLNRIPQIVAAHGFTINPRKTHVQTAKHGRRFITGVAVDADGVHPTRRTKRKLRAAKHRGKPSRVAGLEEWCRLKLPKAARNNYP